ncbi:hypothetical protein BHE74_00040873, partial [Ensete ventricosum]
VAAALARWQPPYQWATTPVAGAAAPAGSRAGRGRPTADPLCERRAASGCARGLLPLIQALCRRPCLHVALLFVGAAPAGCCPCGRLASLTGTAGLPFGLALAVASRPLAGGLGHGLVVGGWPYMGAGRHPSSSLPSLRKHSKNT